MATATKMMPEDLLIATLHKVGSKVRLTDDQRLADILDKAARQTGSVFASFKAHPLYGYSRTLEEALQTLDHAGSIVRENAAQHYFQITEHTAGPFGQSVYDQLDPHQRAAVDTVAGEIGQTFGVADESAGSTGDGA